MTRSRLLPAISLACFASLAFLPLAQAQCNLSGSPETELRVPLVNSAPYGAPNTTVTNSPPETVGSGSVPSPVTPGMTGCPTLIPSHLSSPGSSVGASSYTLPFNPATTSMPGQLGPSLSVPPPPSTPGCDPGYIPGPMNFYPPPVTVTSINPGGGISAYAPTQRWGGQTSTDFGRYKYDGTRKYDFGQGMYYGQNSQDGPYQQLPGAMPTQIYMECVVMPEADPRHKLTLPTSY